MTLIEQYSEQCKKLDEKISAGKLAPEELCVYQELKYRICILDTLRGMCVSAPITTDTEVLFKHFKIVSAYLRFLREERKLGNKTDEEGIKKREAGANSLERVVADWIKRFGSFTPTTPELYKKQISECINAVLPVWCQYRNTYINV